MRFYFILVIRNTDLGEGPEQSGPIFSLETCTGVDVMIPIRNLCRTESNRVERGRHREQTELGRLPPGERAAGMKAPPNRYFACHGDSAICLLRMNICLPCVVLMAFAAIAVLPAQSPKEVSKLAEGEVAAYGAEASVLEHFDTTFRMHADGSGESLVHVVYRVQSEGTARSLSVIAVSYNAETSNGTVENVRVHKPDGTVIATPGSESIEMPAPVTREAPLYSDLKERQLPIRSLAVGDVLEYDLRTVYTKAEAPNQFWGAARFLFAGEVVLSQTLTLEVPGAKYVQVWSPRHKSVVSEHDGVKSYRWTSAQLKPTSAKTADGKPDTPKDPDEDGDGRKLPSVAWTTFHNWAEVGDWYRSLANPRAQPTAVLRARADALTKDAKTPEDQVRALYGFVSESTRYVGIDLGVGRYQPHFAEATLSNQYGDCKDKDTLLEALLRAKGFQTAPALIGAGITPVPEVPSPPVFNHVITTVELPAAGATAARRIWLDATPGVSPYRVLVPQIRDQDALVIPPGAPASLQHTPADPPFAYFERFRADAKLDAAGLLTGKMVLDARSDSELGYRFLLHNAAPAQWDQAVQYLANAMGFTGTASNADLHQTDPAGPAHLAWEYRRPDFADWTNLRILPLFPVLEVTTIDKEKAPEHDIDQGTPRVLDAVTQIHLPEGYRAELPDAIHVSKPYATYDQTYRLSNGDLTVTRKVEILKKKVPAGEWKDYLAYTKAIGMEKGEDYIVLIAPPKTEEKGKKSAVSGTVVSLAKDAVAKGAAAKSPVEAAAKETDRAASSALSKPGGTVDGEASGDVAGLMQKADRQYRTSDFAGEKETLLEVKRKAPQTPYLMSMLGYLAMRERNLVEAEGDLKQELEAHPNDIPSITMLLAGLYEQQKKYGEEVTLLTRYPDQSNREIGLWLAHAQTLNKDAGGAVTTLQHLSEVLPEDRNVATQLASALHEAHRDTEAVAAAKAAMDGSDDANSLNSNSYLLAQMKTELPLAEKSARRSVDLLEAETAKVAVQEANSAAFLATNNLLAVYDTLAYILLLEHRAAEAEPYQRAAWFNRPDITVGNHLAQIEEALNRPDEALTIDDLSLATEHASAQVDDFAEVQRNAERLRKAHAHSSAGDATQALQRMRTFPVKRPAEVKGWGTFRVRLKPNGVADSDLASGSPAVRPMTAALNTLEIKGALPPDSKARILRDGVLSCSSTGATCEFVFLPHSGLQQEGVQ